MYVHVPLEWNCLLLSARCSQESVLKNVVMGAHVCFFSCLVKDPVIGEHLCPRSFDAGESQHTLCDLL
jgi:hypothetical protein